MPSLVTVDSSTLPYVATDPATEVNSAVLEAVVVVADVPWDDYDTRYTSPVGEPSHFVFTDYQINNHFERDGHKYLCGLTSPAGFLSLSASVVQLAAPTLLWVCDWTACRVGAKPKIPDPTKVDGRWVLLDDWYSTAQLALNPDGQTLIWRISGTYVFGCLNPDPALANDLTFPRPPWLNPGAITGQSPLDLSVTSDMLVDGLMRDRP